MNRKFGLQKISQLAAGSLLLLIFLLGSCTFSDKKDGKENDVSPTIKPGEPVLDTDGKSYPTIIIGRQTWMAEDLKKTAIVCDSNIQAQFANGLERGPGVKLYVHSPSYAFYNNKPELGFGVIYNFGAVQKCQLCPPGYRIPTKADWEELIDTLGGMSEAGKHLSIGGKTGFNAEPGGRIDAYGSGMAGGYTFLWSSDTIYTDSYDNSGAYIFEIIHGELIRLPPQDVRTGNYVRCIKVR